MADTDSPIDILEEDACWEILANLEVGRLATSAGDQLEIFPLNYVVDGPTVVFRSAAGSKLTDLSVDNRVAFEVDTWTLTGGESVVIRGRASVIDDPEELARADRLPLRPWINTVKTTFVRITPDTISGRRFRFGA